MRYALFFLFGSMILFLLFTFNPIVYSDNYRDPHPVIYCKEPTFYFGELDNTKKVTHTFVIENKGGSPLTITRVRTCCGCTITNPSNKTILPGKTTTLTAQLSLHRRRGSQKKSITIYSNDPASPRYRLYLEGIAKVEIEIRPYSLKFGSLTTGQSLTKIVTLKCNSKLPFHIRTSKIDSPFFVCIQETVQEDKAYLIKVTAKPPKTPGIFRGQLLLNTNHPKFPHITIPLTIQVLADVVVAPAEIVIHITKNTPASVRRYIAIKSPKGMPFKILSVKPPLDDINVKVQQLDSGMYRIEVDNVVPSTDLNGKSLQITTDLETQKVLNVPFRIIDSPSTPLPLHSDTAVGHGHSP